MPARRHGQSHAEQQGAVAARLHAPRQILEGGQGDARGLLDGRVDPAALDQGPQRPQHFEIRARFDLDEDVGHRRAARAPDVHQDHRAVLFAARHIHSLGRPPIAREQARVGFGRVAPPEDDQVGPVLDLAQRRRALAHTLEGDTRWAVADGRGRIDGAADEVGDGDGLALRLARRVAESVNQREPRIRQYVRRFLHGLGGARFRAADERMGAVAVPGMPGEPGAAQYAGILDLGDTVLVQVHGQDLVVAHAAAKGAGRILDDPCAWFHAGRFRRRRHVCGFRAGRCGRMDFVHQFVSPRT